MSDPASTTRKARAIVGSVVVRIVVGSVVGAALIWLPWTGSGTARAAGDPLATHPRAAYPLERGGDPGVGGGDRPRYWPYDVAVPAAVRAADDALAAARDALRRARRGLEAEVSVAPTLDLLARDDPPRPLEAKLAWRPEASLSWSPLRSEILLAEARVLEAEADRIAAWREATLSALRTPVLLARSRDAVATAERELASVLRERADVDAEIATSAAEVAALARRREAASLDVREARIELDEARRELRDLRAGSESDGPDLPVERRPDLPLPALPEATATRAYRARALRLAADVARSERRWRKAVMPRLGIEVGYAGSDGSVEAGIELHDGRPRGRIAGTLGGTPQERGWATVSALLRLGTDLRSAEAETVAARETERLALGRHAATWTRETVDRWEDARTARARWRVAEARRATVAPDDARGRVRALEAARRSWLRYLVALDKVTTLAETWPELVAP